MFLHGKEGSFGKTIYLVKEKKTNKIKIIDGTIYLF